MKNTDMMHLTLSRSDVIRVRQALRCVAADFLLEADEAETTPERQESCRRSAEMWLGIRDKVAAQFRLQDVEG